MNDDIKNEVFAIPEPEKKSVPEVQPPGNYKIFAVITVARQIEGEYVFIKTERGFRKAGDADKYLKKLKKQYTTQDGHTVPQKVSTPDGDADCICTVGAFELEVDDNG